MSAATDRSTCLANECRCKAAPPALMSAEHWAMVPAALRTSLTAAYRPDGDARAEHLAYVAAARAAVTHKLRRHGLTPRAASTPVQLALFEHPQYRAPQGPRHPDPRGGRVGPQPSSEASAQ